MQELIHVNKFLVAQAQLLGPGIEAVQHGQATTLAGKIANMQHIDTEYAAELTAAIAGGPWTADQKHQLASAVGSRLCVTIPLATATACSGRRRQNQTLMSFNNYLTTEDIAYLKGDASDNAKLNTVVEILEKLGCDIPSEQSIKHIVAVLCMLAHPSISDSNLVFTFVGEIKRLLKVRPKTFTLVRLTVFPDKPAELPKPMYDHIFPVGREPDDSGIDYTKLVTMASSIACRRTNKLVRHEVVPAAPNMASMAPQFMQQLMPFLAQQFGIQPPRPQRLPGLTMLQRRVGWEPSQSSGSQSLALTAPESPASSPEHASAPQTSSALVAPYGGQGTGVDQQQLQLPQVTPFSRPVLSNHPSPAALNDIMAAALLNREDKKSEEKETAKQAQDELPPGKRGRQAREKGGGKGPRSAKVAKVTKAQKVAMVTKKMNEKVATPKSSKVTTSKKISKAQKVAMAKSSSPAKPSGKVKKPTITKTGKKMRVRASDLSMKERLALRPDGCGRCRNVPGCCPSCFINK